MGWYHLEPYLGTLMVTVVSGSRIDDQGSVRQGGRIARNDGTPEGEAPNGEGGQKTTEGPTVNPSTPLGASADCALGDSLVRRTYASH
jgi:hypothetical protein